MKLNPGDNQGVRYLLPECFLYLKKYDEFLNHNKTFEENASLEFLYAKVFAYYKIDDFGNAKTTLKEAKERHPFAAEELVKIKHEFLHDEFHTPLYGIPTGSRQEAFEYWHRTKELWQTEKELKKFIAEN